MFRNFKDLGGLWLLHDGINCTVRDELGMEKDLHKERARLSSVSIDSTRFVKLMYVEAACMYPMYKLDQSDSNIGHFPTNAHGSWTAPPGRQTCISLHLCRSQQLENFWMPEF